MPNFFKKIIGWLIALAVIIGLTILGIQAFFAWKNSKTNQERLEIEHGAEVEERKKNSKKKMKEKGDFKKQSWTAYQVLTDEIREKFLILAKWILPWELKG